MDGTTMADRFSLQDVISQLSFGLLTGATEGANRAPPPIDKRELVLERRIDEVGITPTLQMLLSLNVPDRSTVPVERMSEDVSALILSHLGLHEIAAVSETSKILFQACRSDTLWKRLFEYRWNVPNNKEKDYFQAYRQAHEHPHDLWVTHWNCVYPAEGLTPGRCCLRQTKRHLKNSFQGHTSELAKCPYCRDWHRMQGENAHEFKSDGQQMAHQTLQLQRRLSSGDFSLPDLCRNDVKHAKRAFEAASTFQRKILTSQFKPGTTNFLTDALFFNVTDPLTTGGQWELDQLLNETVDEHTSHSDGLHETGNHSWHVIELRNPDLYRPILFQVGVQRPECFTVYPSEGLIAAGTSVFVTLGIRPLGSALAYAFEGLDIQRDGLPAEWASLYTELAHLPLAPFLFRYRYALTPPASSFPFVARRRSTYVPSETVHSKEAELQHHLQQDFPPHHFRTIHLSAHVNAHFNFWEFFRHTCQPWIMEGRNSGGGPIWIAPVLAEKNTQIWKQIEGNADGQLPLHRTGCLAEVLCEGCGFPWGEREEELVYEYFASHAIASWYHMKRKRMMEAVALCLQVAPAVSERDNESVSSLMYALFSIVQAVKSSNLTDKDEQNALVGQELKIDHLCNTIRVGGERWIPWRLSGVYRFGRCTDSVFVEEALSPEHGKEEPDYLDAFRHLTHCQGHLCLGRQVDPNHVQSSIRPSSPRFIQKPGNAVSDIFMDDPISALQAGICMILDPRSLVSMGVYDRIRYPGSIVRRPKMAVPHLLSDTGTSKSLRTGTSFALMQYVHGVPPAGVGRFALSTFNFLDSEDTPSIVEVRVSGEEIAEDTVDGQELEDEPLPPLPPLRRRPHFNRRGPRGPRLVQMLWTLGASLGLVVLDSSTISSVFVDRTILIATHWISISLMIAPLLATLTARYAQWIPSQPVDYSLEDLPFSLSNEMRFLTERECGLSAIMLIFVWMALGRWTERYTCRDLFRSMLEHLNPAEKEKSFMRRNFTAAKLWFLRRWDAFCPLFLQRRVFSPHWNLRYHADLVRHLAFWRARNLAQHRLFARARAFQRHCFFGDSRDEGINFGLDSSAKKIAVAIAVVLASFSASSPHFWLNLTTVFSSSISLGISVSVQSLEKGRPGISITNTGSFIREMDLLTIFIFAFLVGQLVGSSGGTMFLAEFIVTSISLVLGGAGTVSASAMESWGCFFCLS